jgi:hypothetical protein
MGTEHLTRLKVCHFTTAARIQPMLSQAMQPDAYRTCSAVAAQLYTGPLVLRRRRTRLNFLLGQHRGVQACLECLLVCYCHR